MNRTSLERALQTLAEARGYHFHAAAEEYMARQIGAYPAAWLAPLKLLEIDGRRHGRAVYGVTLHLLCEGARLSPAQRSECWASMEEQALNLFGRLCDEERVIAVEKLTLRPRTFAFTNHGEISLTAEAEVITWF